MRKQETFVVPTAIAVANCVGWARNTDTVEAKEKSCRGGVESAE